MTAKLSTIIFINLWGPLFSNNIIVPFLLLYCNDRVSDLCSNTLTEEQLMTAFFLKCISNG